MINPKAAVLKMTEKKRFPAGIASPDPSEFYFGPDSRA
jgi:hypothetical protein